MLQFIFTSISDVVFHFRLVFFHSHIAMKCKFSKLAIKFVEDQKAYRGWHCIHILYHHLEFYVYASGLDHRDQYVGSFRTKFTEMQANWKSDENNTWRLPASIQWFIVRASASSEETSIRNGMRKEGLWTCADSLGTLENNWRRNQFNLFVGHTKA